MTGMELLLMQHKHWESDQTILKFEYGVPPHGKQWKITRVRLMMRVRCCEWILVMSKQMQSSIVAGVPCGSWVYQTLRPPPQWLESQESPEGHSKKAARPLAAMSSQHEHLQIRVPTSGRDLKRLRKKMNLTP
mmetsp:Transcript_102077/g.255791  ORF Transcript_102077/g.255791 Transcript_102077/m.255791 type:complete len:133 (+) Transcript_102077:1209-1607(+)